MGGYLKDLTERVLITFIQGGVASFTVTEITDTSMWLAVVGGGVAAVTSLFKGLLAKKVGMPDSASLARGV